MPFMIDADTAARSICDGLERGRMEIVFPLPMAVLMKVARLLPSGRGLRSSSDDEPMNAETMNAGTMDTESMNTETMNNDVNPKWRGCSPPSGRDRELPSPDR